MPLNTAFAKAKETVLKVSAPLANAETATEPTDVTIELSAAATAGDTSLTVTALPAALKANNILTFTWGTGNSVDVLITANADVGATTVSVDAVSGDVGDGVPAIDVSATATFDQLYRVAGTETADFTKAEGVTTYTSNTYDSANAVVYDTATIDTASWSISRAGRAKNSDFGYVQCVEAAFQHKPVWVKLERPGEDNEIAVIYEGVAWVTGYNDTGASTALNDGGWTFQGNGKVYYTRLTTV